MCCTVSVYLCIFDHSASTEDCYYVALFIGS
jgi:hypothetical protein